MMYPTDDQESPVPRDLDDDSTWTRDRRYIEGKIKDLERNLDSSRRESASGIRDLSVQLTEIQTDLKAYRRVGQILLAIGSLVGAVAGWLMKSFGKS